MGTWPVRFRSMPRHSSLICIGRGRLPASGDLLVVVPHATGLDSLNVLCLLRGMLGRRLEMWSVHRLQTCRSGASRDVEFVVWDLGSVTLWLKPKCLQLCRSSATLRAMFEAPLCSGSQRSKCIPIGSIVVHYLSS